MPGSREMSTGARYVRGAALVCLGLWLLAACGPPLTPAASPHTATPTDAIRQEATDTPPAAEPATAVAAKPTVVTLPAGELRAWAIAPDGMVYVLDAASRLHQLAPHTLAPLAQSSPLVEGDEEGASYLVAGQAYIFVGGTAISQTLVLDRSDLITVRKLEAYGPMVLDPGRRLLMIPHGLEPNWPFGDFEVWAYELSNLGGPPDPLLRLGGASLDGLAVDPAARRLVVLTSNIGASPPHRGQTYQFYDLDTLEVVADVEWERGSLTAPAFNAQTGEIVASRIGLNWTRRLLVLDSQGVEVRSRPSLDGQPAVDPGGDWIYVLRGRGLWVLRAEDLALESSLPFAGAPPAGLALSPDGETLYLFGNGWLDARSTAELRSLGLAQAGPLPADWFSTEPERYLQPRVYPSPQMEEDGAAFAQLVSGMGNVLETYASTDGGRSWSLVPALLEPGLAEAAFLSLSPDFARDGTLTARVGTALVRSSDRGRTWEPWQPRIAFSSDREGNREIYTMDLQGADVRRLTSAPAADENPAWSPAWTHLAFQSQRHGNWDIFSVRAGCDPLAPDADQRCDLRQLTDNPADDLLPAWSPDGRTIAFVSTRDGNPEIYVMDTDGGSTRRLTFHPSGDWRPAWLPDSAHLLFVSDRGGNNDIYQLAVPPLDGPPPETEPEIAPLIADPADDRDSAVAAGLVTRILFLSDRDGVMRTYVADAFAAPRPFSETDQPEGHPAALPGEAYKLLVSAEREGSVDIYRVGLSEYTPLAPSPGFDGQPAAEAPGWLPDMEASLEWLHVWQR